MGSSLVSFCQHSINCENLQSIALDLSERFNANVEYGYEDWFNVDIETGEDNSRYGFVTLGKIEKTGASEIFFISDEYYHIHQLWDKYGGSLLGHPTIKNNSRHTTELKIAKGNQMYLIMDNTINDDVGYIINDTFRIKHYAYPHSWWWFCKSFTLKNDFDTQLSELNEYRRLICNFRRKIGGGPVLYFSDQDQAQVYVELPHTWEQIIKGLNKDYPAMIFNIPELIKSGKKLTEDDYAVAFYDDFSDLIE